MTITNVETKDAIYVGEAFYMDVTAQNAGDVELPGYGFRVKSFDTNANEIWSSYTGVRTSASRIGPGASKTFKVRANPIYSSGLYYIELYNTDPKSNTYTHTVQIQELALPDLIITDISENLIAGKTNTIEIKVKNLGAAVDQIKLNSDISLTKPGLKSQTSRCSFISHEHVDRGDSFTVTCPIRVDRSTYGPYELKVELNTPKKMNEGSYTNNKFSKQIDFYPDLAVESVTTDTIYADQTFDAAIDIKNTGRVTASAQNVYVDVSYAKQGQQPILITSQNIGPITITTTAKKRNTFTLKNIKAPDLAAGQYNLYFKVDSQNQVAETNENNNEEIKSVTFICQYDLSLKKVLIEEMVEDIDHLHTGEKIKIGAVITNEGVADISKELEIKAIIAGTEYKFPILFDIDADQEKTLYLPELQVVPETIGTHDIEVTINNDHSILPESDYTDNDATTEITIIQDTDPEAEFTLPNYAIFGFPITLDASKSTDDGSIVSYEWYLNEEVRENPVKIGEGKTFVYTFEQGDLEAKESIKGIELVLTDNIGRTGSETKTITVQEWEDNFVDPNDDGQTNLDDDNDDQTNLEDPQNQETDPTINFGDVTTSFPETVYPEEEFEIEIEADVSDIEILFNNVKYDMFYSASRDVFYHDIRAPKEEGSFQIKFTLEKQGATEYIRKTIKVEDMDVEITSSGPDDEETDEDEIRIYVRTNIDVELCKYSTDNDDNYHEMKKMKRNTDRYYYKDVELEEGTNSYYMMCMTDSERLTNKERVKVTFEPASADNTIRTNGTATGLFGLSEGDFYLGAAIVVLLLAAIAIYLFMLKK